MKFSVIVAAHNEGHQIVSSLKCLRQSSKTSPVEIIVVDGGSDDDTVASSREWADETLCLEKPNRGAQWDAGARKATGNHLFFLRADVHPPGNWQQVLERFWLLNEDKKISAAVFSVDYGRDLGLRALSAWSNARVRAGILAADHGLCTTVDIYKAVGGYPPFAELEDFELSRRLRARGRIVLLPELIHAAARRLRARGPLTYALSRVWKETRYKMGASPESLFRQ
ncbi:MAG: glycosyltransferase [Elusimicrobiota bacterium]